MCVCVRCENRTNKQVQNKRLLHRTIHTLQTITYAYGHNNKQTTHKHHITHHTSHITHAIKHHTHTHCPHTQIPEFDTPGHTGTKHKKFIVAHTHTTHADTHTHTHMHTQDTHTRTHTHIIIYFLRLDCEFVYISLCGCCIDTQQPRGGKDTHFC